MDAKEALSALKFEGKVGDTAGRIRLIEKIVGLVNNDARNGVFMLEGDVLNALHSVAEGAVKEVQIVTVDCVTLFATKEQCRKELEKPQSISMIVTLALKAASDQAELQEHVMTMLDLYKEIDGYTTSFVKQELLSVLPKYAKHGANQELLGKLLQKIIENETAQSIRTGTKSFDVSDCVGMGVTGHAELQLGSAQLAEVVSADSYDNRAQWIIGDQRNGQAFMAAVFGLVASSTTQTSAAAENAAAQFSDAYNTLSPEAKSFFAQSVFGLKYLPARLDTYDDIKGSQQWKYTVTIFCNMMNDTDTLEVFCIPKVIQLLLLAASCEDLAIGKPAADMIERIFTLDKVLDMYVKIGIKPFVDLANSTQQELSGPARRTLQGMLSSRKGTLIIDNAVKESKEESTTYLQDVGKALCRIAADDAEFNLVNIGGLDLILSVWMLQTVSTDVDFVTVLDHQSGTFTSDGAQIIMSEKGVHHIHFLLQRESTKVVHTAARVALTGSLEGKRLLLRLCDEELLFSLAKSTNPDVILLISNLFCLGSEDEFWREGADVPEMSAAIASLLEHSDHVPSRSFCAQAVLNFLVANDKKFQNMYSDCLIPLLNTLSIVSDTELAKIVCRSMQEFADNGHQGFTAEPEHLCRGVNRMCGHQDAGVQTACVNVLEAVALQSKIASEAAREATLSNLADVGIFDALLKLAAKPSIEVRVGAMSAIRSICCQSSESARRMSLLGVVPIVIDVASASMANTGEGNKLQEVVLREHAAFTMHSVAVQPDLRQLFHDNQNYKYVIKLIRRREPYAKEAIAILTMLFPEGHDIYELAEELAKASGSAQPDESDSASLQEDIKSLKEALSTEKSSSGAVSGKRQAAAQAISCMLKDAKFRLKETYVHDWFKIMWDARSKRNRRAAQMKVVCNFIANQQVYMPVFNLKMNFVSANSDAIANKAMDDLKSELETIKALEGTVDILKVMDAEAKTKVAEAALEANSAQIIKLEEQLHEAKSADDGAKKSSFAQKMLDLKKTNRTLQEEMQEEKAKVEKLEGMLAEAMEEEDKLRQELTGMTKIKDKLSNDLSSLDKDTDSGANDRAPSDETTADLQKQLEENKLQLEQVKKESEDKDKETQALVVLLESQLCTLQKTYEDAVHKLSTMTPRDRPDQPLPAGDGAEQTKQLQLQIATMKTKYQSNVARLQVDRQKMKDKMAEQKTMFSNQMAVIREGFVKAMDEKDQELVEERASLQAVLRGNAHAAVCYYLSDDDE